MRPFPLQKYYLLTLVLTLAVAGALSSFYGGGDLAAKIQFQMPPDIRDGDLIRGPEGIKVYAVNQYGFKRHILNPAVFEMYDHLHWEDIKNVDQAVLDRFQTSNLYRIVGEKKVYQIEETDEARGLAMKRWLNMNTQAFLALGYFSEQIFTVNGLELSYYQTGDKISMDMPQDQATCDEYGGIWKQWGLLPELSCNVPTTDVGQPCNDSSQCEGACLAEALFGGSSPIAPEGICNEWRNLIGGCFTFMDDGQVDGALCID